MTNTVFLLATTCLCYLHWRYYPEDGFRCYAITLLSDITRPAFLIDLQAVQRAIRLRNANTITDTFHENKMPIPPIRLPKSMNVLVPRPLKNDSEGRTVIDQHIFDPGMDPVNILETVKENDSSDSKSNACSEICLGFIHCQIDMSNMTQRSATDKTFLAQLNIDLNPITSKSECLTTSVCNDSFTIAPAHLVLGLNNHHVISYYWARAAGSGASMEAPGVIVVNGNNVTTMSYNAQLRWASNVGYTACNSNDGKRSEWVGFLKDSDQVQLRPDDFEEAVRSDIFHGSIYGITRSNRPMGSEPIVSCQWDVVSI